MSILYRKHLVVMVSTLVILLMLVDFFFTIPGISDVVGTIQRWGIVLSGFALILGSAYLARRHLTNLFRLAPMRGSKVERWYSAVLLVSMLSVLIIGLFRGSDSSEYLWMFSSFISPLQSTIYSLSVFWLMSASYRAFRVRNIDSAILLIVVFISFLGYIPIGAVIWPGFPDLLDWVFTIQSGTSRAIVVAAALGTFALCLRVLLGQEKAFLGVEEGGGGGE